MDERIVDSLARVPVFGALGRDEVARIAELATPRRSHPGT